MSLHCWCICVRSSLRSVLVGFQMFLRRWRHVSSSLRPTCFSRGAAGDRARQPKLTGWMRITTRTTSSRTRIWPMAACSTGTRMARSRAFSFPILRLAGCAGKFRHLLKFVLLVAPGWTHNTGLSVKNHKLQLLENSLKSQSYAKEFKMTS